MSGKVLAEQILDKIAKTYCCHKIKGGGWRHFKTFDEMEKHYLTVVPYNSYYTNRIKKNVEIVLLAVRKQEREGEKR